jgi:N,N-dimethylformamidase
MSWRHAPQHYAAVHFNADAFYDAGWEPTFEITLPEDTPSGVYSLQVSCGESQDEIPFFVRPGALSKRARICVLLPTFTYVVYGNHARADYDDAWQKRVRAWGAYPHNPARSPQYGLSTYNHHADGSGISIASHRRPLMTLRPDYISIGDAKGSGLRHFQADMHLIAYLHRSGYAHDVVTDHDLDRHGPDLLKGYDVVLTGSHPEYHTLRTRNALVLYRDGGGSLFYLGGNGFYWRIAAHPTESGLLEVRRGEGGIRAWETAPGENYHAFDGCYGGLWRRSGRPPQALTGVGFAVQGPFRGTAYTRCCFDPAYSWVFEGIDSDQIGEHAVNAEGAAGYELDRTESSLGTPENTVVLARAIAPDEDFVLVPEEHLTHVSTISGAAPEDLRRADMTVFETESGGLVFSTGSILFCGALPARDFQNSAARLLGNMLNRALKQNQGPLVC